MADIQFLSAYELTYATFDTYNVFEDKNTFIPTGYQAIDDQIRGLLGGDLMVVCAPVGGGKSTQLEAMVDAAEVNEFKTAKLSLEDGREIVGARMQVKDTGITASELRRHGEAFRNSPKIQYALEQAKKKKRITAMVNKKDLPTVLQAMTMSVKDHKADILYIDYLTSIRPDNKDSRRGFADIVHAIEEHGNVLNVPVVLACQVQRPSTWTPMNKDKSKPTPPPELNIWNIAETSEVERKADFIVMTWKTEMFGYVGKLAKNKVGGEEIKFLLFFDKSTGLFKTRTLDRGVSL